MLRLADLTGPELSAALPDLARLRLRVFRDFPYLYDGDAESEAAYLQAYLESLGAIVVGAFDGDDLVGAATGAPMEDHADAFSETMERAGYPARDIFYFGESVLLPAYRGQGVGHGFFDRREAWGRQLARRWCSFCAVVRPADHPARPPDYRPLDPFWRQRGYRPVENALAWFPWRDVGAEAETEKPMQFWVREVA